ncbi:MAG: M48 family peptidase [Erysipelotrichia bacterium]|nr:M48 family peptidase [Erysipelotrichia bacterium]
MQTQDYLTCMIGGAPRQVEIVHKQIRNLYLRIGENGSIRVSCPGSMKQKEIENFIYSKESWILSTSLKQKSRESKNKEGVTGPLIWWLGEQKYIRYEQSRKDWIFLDGDIMTFYLKDFSDERITRTFRRFAAEKLSEMIRSRRVQWDEEICRKNDIPLPSITVRYMTSRWGSCTPSKSHISMSIRLMHYPIQSAEYVLLHEYVHLLVPNHSKRFYQTVGSHMPDFQEYDSYLK